MQILKKRLDPYGVNLVFIVTSSNWDEEDKTKYEEISNDKHFIIADGLRKLVFEYLDTEEERALGSTGYNEYHREIAVVMNLDETMMDSEGGSPAISDVVYKTLVHEIFHVAIDLFTKLIDTKINLDTSECVAYMGSFLFSEMMPLVVDECKKVLAAKKPMKSMVVYHTLTEAEKPEEPTTPEAPTQESENMPAEPKNTPEDHPQQAEPVSYPNIKAEITVDLPKSEKARPDSRKKLLAKRENLALTVCAKGTAERDVKDYYKALRSKILENGKFNIFEDGDVDYFKRDVTMKIILREDPAFEFTKIEVLKEDDESGARNLYWVLYKSSIKRYAALLYSIYEYICDSGILVDSANIDDFKRQVSDLTVPTTKQEADKEPISLF